MTAASLPASYAPVEAAPAAPLARPRVVMVGTAFAAAGFFMLFVGLIGIYLTLRAGVIAERGTWIPAKVTMPMHQPNVMLLALLMSSVTVQWAVNAIRRDDRQQAYLAFGVTLVFGVAVLNLAAYLYTIMGLDMAAATPFPALVYTITAAHLLMLVGAMIFVGLMAFRALGGQFTSRQYDGVSAAALFWHVQTVVFLFIWYAIYITK